MGSYIFCYFFGVLIYFKIPRKINEALDTKISEIKNELDESEKLRIETKKLLEDSQSKLSSAVKESKKIIDQAKNDSEKMVSELELKFENSGALFPRRILPCRLKAKYSRKAKVRSHTIGAANAAGSS